MKKIGLIGGTSPQSTIEYYIDINKLLNKRLGEHHSAKIIMVSVDFQEIVSALNSDNWDIIFSILKEAAIILQTAGVEILALCSNTLHKVYFEIKKFVSIPMVHILDPIVKVVKQENIKNLAILGTKYTMEESFHISYLKDKINDVKIIVPDCVSKKLINQTIFNSLCKGKCDQTDRDNAWKIFNHLIYEQKATKVLLACTELSHLFKNAKIPGQFLLDTTFLHCEEISRISLL